MLLSDFPQEIIEQFTEFLSVKDKISCSLVCKSWKGVFQDSIYSDLVLSRYLLNNLVNPPQDYQHPYLKTGWLVRYLIIGYHVLPTDDKLYVLQKTFPNIKHLYLNTESLFRGKPGVTADWNIWRTLTELYICFNHSPAPDIENKLVEMLRCLPLLRRLQICKKYKIPIRVSFSLDDFETIHSHLSYLGYLELSSNLLTLSETDIKRMTKVSPATNMGSLNITCGNTDHRWLCYFARKYPNLHALRLYISNIVPEIYGQRNDTIALFQQVPLPFQHLTELTFEYRHWVEKDYLLFWDITHLHNMSIKHLSVCIQVPDAARSPDSHFDISKNIVQVYLPEFANTIESFHLNCLNEYSVPIDFTEIKGNFHNLVDLNISAPTSVDMDTLLCAAPRLRSLTLEHSDIKVKDELYHPNRYELQSFKVNNSKITSDVLRFLSFHCRNLNELTLTSSFVYGNLTTPGCQFIDMACTRLKRLYIGNTSFIIQDNEKCPENLNITLITRLIENIPPKQDYDPNLLPAVVDGPPIKACYDWFCTDYHNNIRDISAAKGSRVQKFVANYEENKRIVLKRTLDKKRRKPYVGWNKSCAFGYTKIKLGYVDDYYIFCDFR